MGTSEASFLTMAIGYFVAAGLGSPGVAVPVILTQWFKGQHMGLALGFYFGMSNFAGGVNALAAPHMIKAWSVATYTWICFGTNIFSLICTCGMIFIDWWAEKKD